MNRKREEEIIARRNCGSSYMSCYKLSPLIIWAFYGSRVVLSVSFGFKSYDSE